jgi:hypothetical protein
MVFVVRFCGLQRSSVVAGIQSGIEALKRLAVAIGLAPGATYVLYRNPQASTSTVTIEIGMPIPDEIAYRNTGELRFGRTPKGIALQGTPADLRASLSDVLIGLRETAAAEGLEYEPFWWQVLPDHEDIEVNAQLRLNLPVRLPSRHPAPASGRRLQPGPAVV